MLKLDIWNSSYNYTIDDVVNNITIDENLASNLESSSSIWKITIPQNNPYILDIIQKDELHAKLYDGATVFYTGWVSTNFNYTIDTHGQQAIQITLEDNGTHLLKTPYTKDESKVISGKFSWDNMGVVQQICNACGITCLTHPDMIQDSTHVEAVADTGESCESLLKSVCKEMKCVYLFDTEGKLYLKPLSPDSLPTLNPIDDDDLYDSINLVRKARTYRGSRIKWKELDTRNGALIYRVIENQDTIHPDCYVTVNTGQELPTQGGPTYIDATDIKNGSEIFSISNVSAQIHCPPADGSVDITTPPYTFSNYGAKSLKIWMKVTSGGHIDKLQATADIRYVKSENVTYGDANDPGESITENLHEIDCRWIHTETPAKYFANFVAQYDRYCSSEFQFTTQGTNTFALGDIIRLNENLHTGLDAYLMVTRRSRTLTSYDSTNKTFGGVWTYRAVATKAFNYNKNVSKESTSAPPSTSYTETQPDISDVSSIQLSTDKSFLLKDLRSTDTQTLNITANTTGGLLGITLSVTDSNGTIIPIDPVTPVVPMVETTEADKKWSLITSLGSNVDLYTISASVGSVSNVIAISVNDVTEYGKNLGLQSSAPNNAIFVADKPLDWYTNSTDGITYEYNGIEWIRSDSASRLTQGLKELIDSGINLTSLSNANTVSFFKDIIAQNIYTEAIRAVQGFFDGITVTGNSYFYGTIKSTALSTTLQNPTPGPTTQLSLQNTAHWNWDTFKNVLKSHYSNGYTSVSGTYPEIRVGSSNYSLPYGPDSGVIHLTNSSSQRSKTTSAWPRTQRVKVSSESGGATGGNGLAAVQIEVNGTTVGIINKGQGTLTISVSKGQRVTATAISTGTMVWYAEITFSDISSDYPDVCFFQSNGAVKTYSGYPTDSLTVGSYTPSPIVYEWVGMSTASGGGETSTNSVLSVVSEDGSINISNKQIVYVSWINNSQLRVVFSDNTSVILDSSIWYQSMSGSFSLITASDLVEIASMKPKTVTTNVGTNGNRFNEGYFNSLYTNSLTNSQSGTNTVWGAVFN